MSRYLSFSLCVFFCCTLGIITHAQKVGIGTNQPITLLDVRRDILINGISAGTRPATGIFMLPNTVFGVSVLANNTDGYINCSFGSLSMVNNQSGTYNTAFGASSLLFNSSGHQNCAFGLGAMYESTTGTGNSALGHNGLYYTNGDYNSSLGFYAGDNNTTGSNNLFVGADANAATGALTNASAIGPNALVGTSNAMVLGSIGGLNEATDTIKVGIGTTSPGARVHVEGTLKASKWHSQNMSENGYAEMGGLLLQWGTVAYNSNNAVLVIFPGGFTQVFSVTATVDAGNNTGSGANVPAKVMNVSPTSFNVAGTAFFSGDNVSKIRWKAIGI